MCGILVYAAPGPESVQRIDSLVQRRGPSGSHMLQRAGGGLIFHGSVLAMQEPVTMQPLHNGEKCLVYNGEIYGHSGNDTAYFFDAVQKNVHEAAALEGEFAFVYWDGTCVWYARDRIGRRSLLHSTDGLVIASVGEGLEECEAGRLYCYNFNDKSRQSWARRPFAPITRTLDYNDEMVSQLLATLEQAVASRLKRPHNLDRVAVLFSGGLDCTLMARLLDMCLPPTIGIDLLNVAFENARTGSQFDTPDRELSIRSHNELCQLSSRDFKLVEVNVPYAEAVTYYDSVRELMAPCSTVMDLSIALAFHLAAGAPPNLCTGSSSTTPILFSGLGADELFAGYARHARAASKGPEALAEELDMDFARLGSRNLGRDDRVCADWGKEVRYPFLDAQVVEFAQRLGLSAKTDGKTTKIILRQVAKQVGLTEVCNEPKRAIQFGARSAKMDPGSGRAKGQDFLA